MSDKKAVVLPRLVFAKDKKAGKGYVRRALHPDFREGELEAFSKIKSEFEWPEELRKHGSAGVYPDCYGLYRLEEGRYFLLRFRDDGYDESGRPHTVSYEAVLYEAPREISGASGISRSLASLLDPGAWLEPDTAVFEPVGSADEEFDRRVEAWLTKKNAKLFINVPESTSRQAGNPAFRQAEPSASRQTVPSTGGARWKSGVFFLLFLVVALSAWLAFEKRNYSSLTGSYNQLSAQNETLKRTLADSSNEQEMTRLREKLDRIKKIVNE